MTTEPNTCPHTYQDLVLDGQTVVAGRRDCWQRWKILQPYLPRSGCVLDIGSNMGWFGWQITQSFPDCVVASVEPDEQSASLQRRMLQSHQSGRICLLTARANAHLARVFERAQQPFDAVLCLSVLHWLLDHREFLTTVGRLARRILVEQPDPRETGAGFERVRTEIGPIGPYLQSMFSDRPVRRLAQLPSHRDCPYPREIWSVDAPSGAREEPAAGLDVGALLALSPSWPPRDWWLQQHDRHTSGGPAQGNPPGCRFTSQGLVFSPNGSAPGLRRRLARLPQDHLLTRSDWWTRRVRRLGGSVLRALRLRARP